MIVPLIFWICAVLSIILGLFIQKGKGLMLIAGYNTMSREEREKVDRKALSKTVGNLIIRMAFGLALIGITVYFKISWATIVLIIGIIIDSGVTTVRLSHMFAKNKASSIGVIAVITLVVIVLVIVGMMYYSGEQDPVITIEDNQIQIDAMYGLDIDFSSVNGVALIEQSMNDIAPKMHRDNGYGGFGGTLRGHFSDENIGQFMLFVKADSSPTIWIERHEDEDIYLSFSDSEITEELFNELQAAIPDRKSSISV